MTESASALPEVSMGDVVYAATDLKNDGSHPQFETDEVVAGAGTRGVVVNVGHPEHQPEKELFLVRFEDEKGDLGPPVGCWAHELSTTVGEA